MWDALPDLERIALTVPSLAPAVAALKANHGMPFAEFEKLLQAMPESDRFLAEQMMRDALDATLRNPPRDH